MKVIRILMIAVAAFLVNSTVALAEENSSGLPNDYGQLLEYETNSHKDQCLIVAKNCFGGDDSVQARVERLNREIDKGQAVYSPEELKRFREELNWIYYESGDYPQVRM